MQKSVAIVGEYTPSFEPHAATNAAIAHSCAALGLDIASAWISTVDLDDSLFRRHQGLWVAPGSPYKDMARTLSAIRNQGDSPLGFRPLLSHRPGLLRVQGADRRVRAATVGRRQANFPRGGRVARWGGMAGRTKCLRRGPAGIH